jgi:hypothetical protein
MRTDKDRCGTIALSPAPQMAWQPSSTTFVRNVSFLIMASQLSSKLGELRADDLLIQKEGVETLSVKELQVGMRRKK